MFHKLRDHVAEHRANGIETLVCVAYVPKSCIVQENFLYDEDGDRLAQFGSSLHDAQTKRDNLCCQEEVDDFSRVILDQRANNAKGSKS